MADLSFPRGTTYRLGVTVKENEIPIDLTSSSVRFTLKKDEYDQDIDDNSAILTKDDSGSPDGVVNIKILPADTAMVEPGVYYYDIKVEKGDDNQEIYLIDQGTITLTGTPTNRMD